MSSSKHGASKRGRGGGAAHLPAVSAALPPAVSDDPLDAALAALVASHLSGARASATAAPPAPPPPAPPRRLLWPSLPVPSLAGEAAFIAALDGRGGRASWARSEPLCFHELPRARRREIAAAARGCGLALAQAAGVRSQLLLDFAPWRFHGNEAATAAESAAFEAAVGRHLARAGVAAVEQAAQARGAAGGTPDFLLPPGTLINGLECSWIEVKMFYGLGTTRGLKPWLPVLKAQKQLQRYRDHFGCGAVVMVCGGGQGFVDKLPPGVVMLDASPFGDDELWP